MRPTRSVTKRLRPAFLVLWLTSLLAGIALAFGAPAAAQDLGPPADASKVLDVIHVKGIIDPPTSDYLRTTLAKANADGVAAAVIQIDTPGGLNSSTREIIQQILDSRVPVVVWVAPRGARAASAGTFIAYAAHLAYMAEATEIGAATPIDLSGTDLSTKITNDAAAFIEELAINSGRDPEFAIAAVREGASIGATEAAERNVVNGMASSLRDLMEAMDGERVETSEGSVTIETWDESRGTPSVTIRFQQMNIVQRLLHAVTGPEIAYLLMLVGFFGIIFELYNPGIGLAGILGAVCLLLGFYGLSVLPTNWVGVILLVMAIAFFIVDLQIAGFGIWTAGGIIALIVGGMLLFSGVEAVTVSPWAIVAAVVGSLLFFVSIMTAALRVRTRRPITGEESIVGTVGVAKTDIAPEGTVLSKGMLWKARTMEMGIAAGDKVEVKATEGLVLLVEPYHGDEEPEPADIADSAF